MNSAFKLYSILLCLFSLLSISLHAQVCRNNTVNLDANGHYTIKKEDVVQPFYLTEDHILIYPREFTCADIGNNTVRVLIYRDATEYIECTANVLVKDVIHPVAKCFSNLDVVLDGQGQHVFTTQAINRQSSDECSVVGVRFLPYRITCSDPNPMNVLVIANDAAGNLDTCNMLVTWEAFPGPAEDILCRDSIVIRIDGDEEIMITPELVLQDIPYGCPDNFTLALFESGNLRPQPIITVADSSGNITATVTDNGNGNQCSVPIIVKTNYQCYKPTLVCDVQCRSAPVADCASGHTLEDEVEWPCNIILEDVCPDKPLNLDPEYLIWLELADSADASPAVNSSCLFTGFYDIETDFSTEKVIQRFWTVLDWPAQLTYEYVQILRLKYDLADICDTLPWNAATGDCSTGHTLSDDVEWPADITIQSALSRPEDLEKNSEVIPQNIRPQLTSDCVKVKLTYADEVTLINDNTVLINRTWVAKDLQSLQEWQYVQKITSVRDAGSSTVCVTRENGQAIPGVELVTGIFTDVKGCYAFENPGGIIVSPSKIAALKQNVNVQDQIAIREYLLGYRTLSVYQLRAADVDQDGNVDEDDIAAIDEIIAGTFAPSFTYTWKFFEVETNNSIANISNPLETYHFIGVKIGDVVTVAGEEELFIYTNDEVLNAGETYDFPFYIEYNGDISGLGLQFHSPNEAVEFLSITAPQIPDFTEGHYHAFPGYVNIVWIASLPNVGVPIRSDEPFLIVKMKANENIILHDAIRIGTTLLPEFIPPSPEPAYVIRLHWENGIVLSTLDIGDGRKIDFYPNPVSNEMHFSGLTDVDEGIATFYNALGQIVLRVPLQETLDVSSLFPGTYFMSVLVDGIHSKATQVIKY